uniref:Uncharacterized protein n=1 Tax=Candidatus Methanogaster sp. ANME-2c ERB4 TaxID=2759911 RepID=A0A7G9Y2E9_9EURY|nr:hypothetical protein EHLBLFLE_00005 [Methanosarcinales archaeon ANME-2c ERB4]QNO42398.1 hypothetical protein LFOPHFOE_00038 [Methanosarcinales archaeon ANME-2c ERB4]
MLAPKIDKQLGGHWGRSCTITAKVGLIFSYSWVSRRVMDACSHYGFRGLKKLKLWRCEVYIITDKVESIRVGKWLFCDIIIQRHRFKLMKSNLKITPWI